MGASSVGRESTQKGLKHWSSMVILLISATLYYVLPHQIPGQHMKSRKIYHGKFRSSMACAQIELSWSL